MMKWKVTKSSRSSSFDRSAADCEISEGPPEATKPLPPLPCPLKGEQIKKEEDTIALLPPSRRKHSLQQNGGLGLSRKDSFAASDCIPINLKEILGLSRQRSETHLNSLPVLNGERRRSRSEVRVSSTDRLTIAYHSCQVISPQNKLTERNQPKSDQLPILNGRCPSPVLKSSRWLRGRQRQREPRKSMLGICGGVTKTAPVPNGRIPNSIMDRKNLSLQETIALIHNSPPEKPVKEPNNITDKVNNSKDNVASHLNGETEKELDKENIKVCRTNEASKQHKEGYRFRRNKGFAPRPGMRRSQNEHDKDLNSIEEVNHKPVENNNCSDGKPGAKEKKDADQNEKNSLPDVNENATEDKILDGKEKEVLKDSDEEVSKHCAKKRRDSSGAVVTRTSESSCDSKSSDEQLVENKVTSSPKIDGMQTSDLTKKNNKVVKSELSKSEENTSVNCLENGCEDDSVENRVEKSSEESKPGFYLHEDVKSSSEDLRVNLDNLKSPKKKNQKSARSAECSRKVKGTRNTLEESSMLLPANGEVENGVDNIPKQAASTEKNSQQVSNCDDTICEESEAQETTLDSLAPVEEIPECMDTHPADTSSKMKLRCAVSPPPKKKMASHQGMTVSVVVRKPPTSEEIDQPIGSKQAVLSNSESFVVKKSFVLTIAKQEMGFRSMCASKESSPQALETADVDVKKEEHKISVTFLCAGNVKEPWINGQTSTSPVNDVRLRSFSMPPGGRYHQQQNLLCLESVRSRSKEIRNKEKQTIKRKSHRQKKKDTSYHMPKAVIDELSKVLEKRKRCIEDDDDEDDDYYYDEDQDGDSE